MALTLHSKKPAPIETLRSAVLFADLRGYTTLAEHLDPPVVVRLLQEFFALLGDAVDTHGGRLFHMAGDSMMAGFSIDELGPEAARAAVRSGMTIVRKFDSMAARWHREIGVPMGVGIGVHVGEVACAAIGPPGLRRKTLIGDTVNVAARLCQRARAREVLFSAAVVPSLNGQEAKDMMPLPAVAVRGRDTPVEIYCVPTSKRLTTARTLLRAF
jgi:adenylate cyclase